MRQVQIYVDVSTSNININCDCISVTYQLVGEEPVTVEVNVSGVNPDGKNYYDEITSPLDYIYFIEGEWRFESNEGLQATLSIDSECPFGTYTIEEGSIFESFVVSGCDLFEYKKLELFEDEQINVTSSVQNINDISKVFTDEETQ